MGLLLRGGMGKSDGKGKESERLGEGSGMKGNVA